jgi:hypothetical protein
MYSDNIEQKKELIKGVSLGRKDEFELTPLPQVKVILMITILLSDFLH